MAKCDEGYLCDVCGQDVGRIEESDLYLRYVIGMVHPEVLHVAQERHIRCNPVLAQFIVAPDFLPVEVDGPFDKKTLADDYVQQQESLVTRGWHRLREVAHSGLPIIDYPLPEAKQKYAS
ncbi:MAG: hypothetical protein R3E01_23230 [Pirellulaceae bacterium]|nr:hypothetical protein [Planctomycetales bacterium]